MSAQIVMLFFFFNDTATTEIYTLSLHDALPIYAASAPGTMTTSSSEVRRPEAQHGRTGSLAGCGSPLRTARSEEHTSELQSQSNLVCRLLLEKKKDDCDTSC